MSPQATPPSSSPQPSSAGESPTGQASNSGYQSRQVSAQSSQASADQSGDAARNGQSTSRADHPHAGNGNRQPQDGRELKEQGEQIYDDLRAIAGSLRHAADDWQQLLRERLKRQPYAVLAIAAGAGYVLGGGLPRGLARAVLTIAVGQAIQHGFPSFPSGVDSSDTPDA